MFNALLKLFACLINSYFHSMPKNQLLVFSHIHCTRPLQRSEQPCMVTMDAGWMIWQ